MFRCSPALRVIALSLFLLCSAVIDSARAADYPAPASQAETTPDIVNGKWNGTLHTKYDNLPEIVTTITKRAHEGAPCKTVLEYARDEHGNMLLCLNDAAQTGGQDVK
jgi:hypothetical protein